MTHSRWETTAHAKEKLRTYLADMGVTYTDEVWEASSYEELRKYARDLTIHREVSESEGTWTKD